LSEFKETSHVTSLKTFYRHSKFITHCSLSDKFKFSNTNLLEIENSKSENSIQSTKYRNRSEMDLNELYQSRRRVYHDEI